MRKFTCLSAVVLLALLSGNPSQAQRQCGNALQLTTLRNQQPAEFQRLREQRQSGILEARKLGGVANKETAQYPIPVVFHVIVTQDQYNYLGQDTGIKRRVRSQLAGLNRDFNRQNGDSTAIPAPFKPFYTSVGIQFGLASTHSANTISAGIEVKVLSAGTIPDFDANVDCYHAKHSSSNGLDAWDVDKYMNVWVGNLTAGGSGTIVGLTTPPTMVGTDIGGHTITADEKGMVLNYRAFGVREFPAQQFIPGIDLGRTMTHEMGHYFELWHTWGDDGGCAWDDDISDTPLEYDAQFCNNGVCPNFPKTDNCSSTSPGIMFMNYMDYVDDKAMMMFTAEQGAVMRFFLQQDSWSLTQNPDLVKVNDRILSQDILRVSPNPARTMLRLETIGLHKLQNIELINTLGQTVYRASVNGTKSISIERQDWAPGVYYLHCQFAEGMLSKKIVFE